jgi:NodT family efflux transporter outer membrane factor (OMF) lipoprotein
MTRIVLFAVLVVLSSGCTSWRDYVHNGFKVGPNYKPPKASVERQWIDAADIRSQPNPEILKCWWILFNDRKLNELVTCAYRQNLTLREAGFRVLQARAALAIARGEIFPQRQTASGSYTRSAIAVDPGSPAVGRFFDTWNFGFGLAWEVDFWGRFRRAIAAGEANLDASVAGYDDVLVTLLGDVAANYVTVRTTQERIRLLRDNAKFQRGILTFVENRLKAGWRQITELDVDQALSTLRQTEAGIEQLEIPLREAQNALCILLGMPPADLTNMLGNAPIPAPGPEVVLGVPADLLRRRPDVRRAERLAAAQAEEIGIAETELYPAFSINGNFGYTAKNFSDLFRSTSFNGSLGPSFQWNILNYGRLLNNVRLQDARFLELVVAYQNTVLQAQREVENGLVQFLRSQRRSRLLDESVAASRKARDIVVLQYNQQATDFGRYALIEQNLLVQQDSAAQAQGDIAQGLIAVYRALGGGWEIRLAGSAPVSVGTSVPPAPEPIPAPPPVVVPPKVEDMRAPNEKPPKSPAKAPVP